MTLELFPLCNAKVSLAEAIIVSPTLVIGEVTDLRFEGDRLKASLRGRAAADWMEISPSGYGTLDVRATLETDDGAVLFVSYRGRLQLDAMTVYATPLFQTGDERYQWLTRIQVVAKGTFTDGPALEYEMYELR